MRFSASRKRSSSPRAKFLAQLAKRFVGDASHWCEAQWRIDFVRAYTHRQIVYRMRVS